MEYRYVRDNARGTLTPVINETHAEIIRAGSEAVKNLFSMNGVNILDKKYDNDTKKLLKDIKEAEARKFL